MRCVTRAVDVVMVRARAGVRVRVKVRGGFHQGGGRGHGLLD